MGKAALLKGGGVFVFQTVPINLVSQSGLRRRVDNAAVVLNILDKAVHIRPGTRKELKELTVRHRHRDVQVGDII